MFKARRLIAVFAVLSIAVILLFNFLRGQYVLPILMYHSVTLLAQKPNALALKPDTFERQMRFLKTHHYRVIPLEQAVELVKEKKKIPPKTVVLTFDDGYQDNYFYAFSVLKKYQFPATFFIIIDEVGRAQDDRLSWKQIKEMQDSGLAIFGSHALGPDPLIKIKSAAELERQVSLSRKILAEKLGREVQFFSYPEGMFNEKIREAVINAGYLAAVATSPGKNYPDDDIFALKRLRISENSANLFVFAVESSGYYTFMKEAKRKHGHGKK